MKKEKQHTVGTVPKSNRKIKKVACYLIVIFTFVLNINIYGVRRGRDRMVVGFATTCAISAYHHSITARCTTLCDRVCE